jgi:hypothetical protein
LREEAEREPAEPDAGVAEELPAGEVERVHGVQRGRSFDRI